MSCIRGLTLKLQMEALDVLYAYHEVQNVVTILKNIRSNSDKEFSRIFSETMELGKISLVRDLNSVCPGLQADKFIGAM